MKDSQAMLELASRFNQSWQDIENLYEEYAKAHGLTYMAMLLLDFISEAPEGITQKQLAALAHMPKQSVNTIVKAFWEQGHVALLETPADRRNKRITLTEQGKAYADSVIGPLWEAEQLAMGQLAPETRDAITEGMEAYTRNLRALFEGFVEGK